jgi:cytochrome c6
MRRHGEGEIEFEQRPQEPTFFSQLPNPHVALHSTHNYICWPSQGSPAPLARNFTSSAAPCRLNPPSQAATNGGASTSQQSFVSSLIAATIISLSMPVHAHAETDVVQQFNNNCAGCHSGGGNIVNRSATLQLSDLTKYGLSSPDDIYQVIYSGRGSMPGYGENCEPKGRCTFGKRLSNDEVQTLAKYVYDQAQAGWPLN